MNYEIIFHSLACPFLTHKDVRAILEESRGFNNQNDITGCLLHYKKEFLQILEGKKEKLVEIFGRIKKDKRHQNIYVVHQGYSPKRKFINWSMVFMDMDQIEDINHYLNIDDFKRLNEVKNDDSLGEKLFSHISSSILKQPICEL